MSQCVSFRIAEIACVSLYLAFCPAALAQNVDPPIPPTLYIECDQPAGAPKNVVVASSELEAPNTGYRAWVQVVSATASNSNEPCYNTTVVWVSTGKRRPFQAAYIYVPNGPELLGNGIRLVSWSPNGRLLLAQLWRWNTQPNDAGVDKHIVIFRPGKKSKIEIGLHRLLDEQRGKNCFVDFELLGFTSTNRVAVKTHLATWLDDGDELSDVPVDKRCKETYQTWQVDPYTQTWRVLPSNFAPSRQLK